jgi:translation initiation factor IF-3
LIFGVCGEFALHFPSPLNFSLFFLTTRLTVTPSIYRNGPRFSEAEPGGRPLCVLTCRLFPWRTGFPVFSGRFGFLRSVHSFGNGLQCRWRVFFRNRQPLLRSRAIKKETRVNEDITAPRVLLIMHTGEQKGELSIQEALEIARKEELDLVEVAPEANPPVCRLQDYKKLLYEVKRRAKESKKKAKAQELKECKMRITIDPHDRSIKLRKVREFLEEGDKVKFTIQFRGREVTKPQLGEALVQAIREDLQDIGEVDQSPA